MDRTTPIPIPHMGIPGKVCEAVATLTIYGEQTTYDPKSKRTDSELRKLVIELCKFESWRAPLGFNVTGIEVK